MLSLNNKVAHALLAAGLLAASSASHAAVTTLYFGSLLKASTGYTAPNDFLLQPFANLETVNSGNVWNFTLSINNNLFSSFGNNAYISSVSFDFNPDPINQPVSSFTSSNVGGVHSVTSTNGGSAYGLSDIDFGTEFGKGSKNRLSQNDYVSWNVSGLSGTKFVNMYIDVEGIGNGYSAKYTPQGVTAEQLATLNAEAVRTKGEAETRKGEAETKKGEAEHAAADQVNYDSWAAAAKKARDDALAAAADQSKIDELTIAAEKARVDAESASIVALATEAERVKAEAECAKAVALAEEAEWARAEAEHKKAEEDDFRHRVIARDDWDHEHAGGGTCVSPVPEPETYAMLLAGLGLIGFRARRKMNNS